MKKLDKAQIASLESDLTIWQSPIKMQAYLDEALHEVGSTVFFNQAGLAFLRDAWTAANFGIARNARQVRLVSDVWPDFELQMGDEIEPFEAVEADDPKRRRGLEFRNFTDEILEDPVEDWIRRAEAAPAWIEKVCQGKAAKSYIAGANLVVYLNMGEYGIRQKQVEASFATSTTSVRSHFHTVWVLWQANAYLVWKEGRQPQR